MTDPATLHLRVHQAQGLAPGPRLIVLGAVHGNETCGTLGIERVLAEIDSGALPIVRGLVTFVPRANPLAFARGQRSGERNLNRNLRPGALPQDFEDRIANRLCPLLAAHEVLLDLHSIQSPGEPFAMLGPRDNRGALEPFTHAADEERLARHLGPRRIVEGWLDVYEAGVRRRRERGGGAALVTDPNYGVGTTEYMRASGGWGLTLECGQHADPNAPQVAWRAIRQALALLGIADIALEPPPAVHDEMLRLAEVTDRLHPEDRFSREWVSFDPVHAGEVIARRHDGTPVLAPAHGRIVFPNPRAEPGQEWFYLALPSDRRLR